MKNHIIDCLVNPTKTQKIVSAGLVITFSLLLSVSNYISWHF